MGPSINDSMPPATEASGGGDAARRSIPGPIRGGRWLAVVVLASLVGAPAASADFFATFDTAINAVRAVNVTTGASVSLPSGVDEAGAREAHISLSPDGKYLVFARYPSGGVVRIVMVERATGRSADLFNAFEAGADPPSTPAFSSDGTKVLTGRPLEPLVQQFSNYSLTETDVTRFPTGPFPHRTIAANATDLTPPGRTLQPAPFGSNSLAFGIETATCCTGRIVVQGTHLAESTRRLANPAISESAGVVVFESAPLRDTLRTKLVYRPLANFATAATTALPAVVNAPDTTVRSPAFTRDGRYLAFVRHSPQTAGNLYLWDTQTQQLLNPDGVSSFPDFKEGAIALEDHPVFTNTSIISGGSTTFSNSTASSTGLFVQRIVGRHKLLGRTAPSLRFVGRVPLGSFGRGRHLVRWSFTVGGRKLPRGCYLVTVRALTRKRQVRDLSTPYTVRIVKHRRPLVRKGIRLHTCPRTP